MLISPLVPTEGAVTVVTVIVETGAADPTEGAAGAALVVAKAVDAGTVAPVELAMGAAEIISDVPDSPVAPEETVALPAEPESEIVTFTSTPDAGGVVVVAIVVAVVCNPRVIIPTSLELLPERVTVESLKLTPCPDNPFSFPLVGVNTNLRLLVPDTRPAPAPTVEPKLKVILPEFVLMVCVLPELPSPNSTFLVV